MNGPNPHPTDSNRTTARAPGSESVSGAAPHQTTVRPAAASGDPHQTTAQPGADPNATSAGRAGATAGAVPPGVLAIPGYDLLPEIARGGMGVVYRAWDRTFGREVAVKVMLPGQRASTFVREARITARLPHPGIPPVYAMGPLPDGRPYLAMKLIVGDTLDAVLKGRGDLAADRGRLLAAFEQMCQAVGYAHARGIVHRDLKPSNVMVGAFGEVQVMDWGLAKEIGGAEAESAGPADLSGEDAAATVAGQVKGTPAYMAPEQARGEPIDARADVFALGGILAAILTGRPPFAGHSVLDTIIRAAQADLSETFVRIDEAGADPELVTVCKRCLAPHRDDRYLDGTAVAWAVARYRADVEQRLRHAERERAAEEARAVEEANTRREKEAKAAETRKRRRAQWGLAAAAVLLLAAGGVGAAFASLWRKAETERDTADAARKEAVKATDDALKQKKIAENSTAAAKVAQKDAERARGAQAAQADDLVEVLNGLFQSSDPMAVFFGEGASQFGIGAPTEGQAATLRPVLQNAFAKFRVRLADPDPAVQLARAKLLVSVGNGMRTLAMYAEAREALAEALELRRKHLPETAPEVWQSELALAQCDGESGDVPRAAARLRAIRAAHDRGQVPEEIALSAALFEGVALSILGDPRTTRILAATVEGRKRLPGPDGKDLVIARALYLSWLIEAGTPAEIVSTVTEFQKDLANVTNERVRVTFQSLLQFQTKLVLGRVTGAKAAVEGIKKDFANLERHFNADNIMLSVCRFELGRFLLEAGDPAGCDALWGRVLTDVRNTVGLAHPKALPLLTGMVLRYKQTGNKQKARELLAEFESANVKRFGPVNPWLTTVLLERIELELEDNRPAAARPFAERVLELVRNELNPPARSGVLALLELAPELAKAPELGPAGPALLAAARPLVERARGTDSTAVVNLLHAEALALINRGDRAKAAERLADARSRFELNAQLSPIARGRVLFTATELELARADFPAARAVLKDLRAALAEAKKVDDADRYEIALMEANAHVGSGNFAAAVAPLLEARRAATKLNKPPSAQALLDLRAAECRLADGKRDEYRAAVTALLAAHEQSTELDVLTRLAWAAGIDPQPNDWNAKAFETRFAAAFQPTTNFAWGYRGLALVRLRAGKLKEAEDALDRASKNPSPQDPLLRGLIAAARGDKDVAKAQLAKAEEQLAARAPSGAKPFAYANHPWYAETGTQLLLRELNGAAK